MSAQDDETEDGVLADWPIGTVEMCEACSRGDHANCGMQSWCHCQDESDGCDW